jgi:hypothetical protein
VAAVLVLAVLMLLVLGPVLGLAVAAGATGTSSNRAVTRSAGNKKCNPCHFLNAVIVGRTEPELDPGVSFSRISHLSAINPTARLDRNRRYLVLS